MSMRSRSVARSLKADVRPIGETFTEDEIDPMYGMSDVAALAAFVRDFVAREHTELTDALRELDRLMVMPVGFLQDRLQRGKVANQSHGLRVLQVAVDVNDGHAMRRRSWDSNRDLARNHPDRLSAIVAWPCERCRKGSFILHPMRCRQTSVVTQ
jgi:hypothetical protein